MNLRKYIKFKVRTVIAMLQSVKTKVFIITVLLVVYFIIFFVVLEFWYSTKIGQVEGSLNLEHVIVHIDMKGSPPKLTYLKSLLPELQELGVTGLLLEYEDMFPYEGRLVNISATNCYEKTELYDFVSFATQLGLEVIPLVQTFGHMEHVLKLAEFKHLREVPLYPDSICPSKAETHGLIKDMLEQVIIFHNEITPLKHFHIGCDEVFQINKCHLCTRRGLRDTEIFVSHLKAVTDIVKAASPNTTILIWDDSLKNIPLYKWESFVQDIDVEPVCWDYGTSVSVSHVNLMKYHEKFGNIWVASAFKGADGRSASFPDIRRRLHNHYSWLTNIYNYKFGSENMVYKFKGIILTGWSRYSHFDPPCELLPVSIPSLFFNLILVKHFKTYGQFFKNESTSLSTYISTYFKDEFMSTLKCSDVVNLDFIDGQQCLYNGHELITNLKHLKIISSEIYSNLNDETNDLASIAFYTKTFNVNMHTLKDNIQFCNDTLKELWHIEVNLRRNLKMYYGEWFVNEYVDYKMYNLVTKIQELLKHLKEMMKVRSWGRRPYR
ncbi:unnamed protein product [Leptidea sinapis]|uniref:beta-N-acetylhexosaminidase n=1 Tax=Leptidea sinapis TaxID=189913 RepID=A0A5E4QQH5_9NEOP|nr:unnamed protein product [Leptidea sinapis]